MKYSGIGKSRIVTVTIFHTDSGNIILLVNFSERIRNKITFYVYAD